MRVAVRRLSLRLPPGHLAASRQRAEDALFLAAPEETRLVLLRRLDLGRLPPRAPSDAWTARAAERLAERRARAVHAAQPGAESADAVWFRSSEEARELLLLLLAAGRRPTAWFWHLAVPEWRGLPLPQWLAARLDAALAEPAAEVALARAVIAAARAGRLPAVAAALASAILPEAAPARAAAPRAASAPRDVARLAPSLLARFDATVRQAIRRAIADLPARSLEARWIARLVIVAAAPELAQHGAALAPLMEAAIAELRAGAAPPAEPMPVDAPAQAAQAEAHATLRTRHDDVARPTRRRPMPRDPPPPASLAPATAEAQSPALARPQASALPPDAPAAPLEEQASGGAGVLLAIRALDRLGLGARLARDADAAASGFGRHLLRHIATRARVPQEDALLTLLAAPGTPPDADALQAWRVGLDRWLRRRVRLRLADLARRRGWLHLADTTLLVRFPLDAADIRLRRLTLDPDPGWVPWLGLSVRYHYRDTPLA